MGLFSKVFKGVKSVFKKVGKGIKSAVKKTGKFMNKLGFLGTIGLSILTGGLGIGSMFGKFGTYLQSIAGDSFLGKALKGVAWTIDKAQKFGNTVRSGFKTLTDGVTTFLGETGKYIGGKLGFKPETWGKMSWDNVWNETSGKVGESWNTFKADLTSLKDGPLTIDIKRDATGKIIEDFDDALARAQKEGKIIIGEGGRMQYGNKALLPDERFKQTIQTKKLEQGSEKIIDETTDLNNVTKEVLDAAAEVPTTEGIGEITVGEGGWWDEFTDFDLQKKRLQFNLQEELRTAPSKFVGDSILAFGQNAIFGSDEIPTDSSYYVPYSPAFRGIERGAATDPMKGFYDQKYMSDIFDYNTGIQNDGYQLGIYSSNMQQANIDLTRDISKQLGLQL